MVRDDGRLSRRKGLRAHFALVIAVTAMLTIFISSASAEIVVDLAGSGAGTVTSSPAGIECSNVSGAQGSSCSASYGFEFVQLTVTPGIGFEFTGWSGSDPLGGF